MRGSLCGESVTSLMYSRDARSRKCRGQDLLDVVSRTTDLGFFETLPVDRAAGALSCREVDSGAAMPVPAPAPPSDMVVVEVLTGGGMPSSTSATLRFGRALLRGILVQPHS